ncbi:MAG: polyphenol oxidase family protein [Spirochaetaceae bacterium]|nr:polyphenol oxidase family protein [Spirochaetaceae bacterium]
MNGAETCNLYPFKIDGEGKKYAVFPFMYDGKEFHEISCLITLRAAGSQLISIVRERLFAELGIADKKFFHCSQNHTRDVVAAAQDDEETYLKGDGLVAKGRDIGLYVIVADCLPVYLFDTASGAFSVSHSGWEGTGISVNALRLMTKTYQTKPENVAAVLGPCIRSCCYDVDEERAVQYEKEFGGGEKDKAEFPLGPVVRKDNAEWYIDMQAANASLLYKNGVKHIAYCTNCTFTDENFGSFRRQVPHGDYTKMLAIATHFPEWSNHA